jgi:RNA polymerase sigma factor (sigma-70 family)
VSTEAAAAVLDRDADEADAVRPSGPPAAPSIPDRSVAEQLAAVEPLVRGICRSRLGAADGDDAAQRTMLTLWRRLEAGDRTPIESLPGYAAVCARYEVLASLGEFHRQLTMAIGEATERACVDDDPGPEAQTLRAAEVAEAAARVEQLLAALTPREAEVLRATKLAATEPDTATAARALCITPSSVRSAQVRAMARLRELCGTRSPNPLASQVPLAERRKAARASWAAHSARAAEQMAHPTPAQTEFAEDFLRRRLDRGLSQSQLGAALGCDGSYVSKVERGKTWPSREFARRLDEALDAGEALQRCHDQHITASADRADQTGARDPAAEPDPTEAPDTTPAAATPAATAEAGDRSGHLPCCLPDLSTDPAALPDRSADRDAVEDATTDEDTAQHSSAAAACAMARAAVHVAVAPDVERNQAAADEQARAEQLTRWHSDDHTTAAGDVDEVDLADGWAGPS